MDNDYTIICNIALLKEIQDIWCWINSKWFGQTREVYSICIPNIDCVKNALVAHFVGQTDENAI